MSVAGDGAVLDRVAGGKNRPVQQVATRIGWTQGKRQLFLNELAATCNVRGACRAVGLSQTSAYQLRRRDPAFAALWREALTMGYERLEEAMLRYALGSINAITIDPEHPGPLDGIGAGEAGDDDGGAAATGNGTSGDGLKIGAVRIGDLQVALQLLNRYADTMRTGQSYGGPQTASPSAEETNAALRRKLDSLARRKADHAE